MPEQKLIQVPGITTQPTKLLNQMGWSTSNRIRWKAGMLEKLGGWQKFCNDALTGVVRQLHEFQDLSGNLYVASGSDQRLQLVFSNQVVDITPIRATNDITNAFSTTSGSRTVNVEDAGNNADVGDWINITTQVSIGGILLFGYYIITAVVDSDNYEIEASTVATATVSSGGATPEFNTTNTLTDVTVTLEDHGLMAGDIFTVLVSTTVATIDFFGQYLVLSVSDADNFMIEAATAANATTSGFENNGDAQVEYLLPSGLPATIALTGYGGGGYGLGTYGVGASSIAFEYLRLWSLDNFGQVLLAVPNGGKLYAWTPPVTYGNVATEVATAPTKSNGMFVAMPQRQCVLWGTETGGTQDDLLIRWSDVEDYTDFTATITNQAGSFRLSTGSRIVGAAQAPQAALIWTDQELWVMQYIQPPLIYSFISIGNGCGLIAQNAQAQVGRSTFWMSQKGVFSYGDNGIAPIVCMVWDKLFGDLDLDNSDKVFAAPNALFNEVSFFYPSESGGTGEIDSYAKLNTAEGLWDYGTLVRTSWIDSSALGPPIASDEDSYLQQHEIGFDDDGSAMDGVEVMSGYIDIAEGLLFVFIDQIIPDFYFTGDDPSVTLTIYTQDYSGGPTQTFGPYEITPQTEYLSLRARARQIAFKIECDSLGTFWRLGAMRYRGSQSGRR